MMPPSLSSEGNRLLAAGMIKEAIQSFEAALKTDPNDARCLLGLAKAHLATSADDAALASLNKLLQAKPDHLEARSHRGFILAKKGDPAGPAELDAVAKDRRAGFDEHFNYGRYLVAAKQDDKAQKEFEACVRIESRDPRPYVEQGLIALRRKDLLAATNHFQKGTQFAGPQDAGPWVMLARAYRQAKQGPQAAAAYLESLQRRSEDDALVEEAYKGCVEAGEFDTALKAVLLARQRKPDDRRYAQWQEEVMGKIKSGGGKKTQQRYEEGDSSSIDVDKEIARANDILGRNPPTPPHVAKEVIKILDQILRVQPNHGDALSLMGLCMYLTGKWEDCEAYGKKALAAGEAAKNKVWKENADLLLANLARKRAEKKGGGAKPAPAAAKPAAPPAKAKR